MVGRGEVGGREEGEWVMWRRGSGWVVKREGRV